MRDLTRQRIAQELAEWRHQGLISADTGEVLAARYGGRAGWLSTLLKWFAFLALFQLGSAALGVVGMALGAGALYAAPAVSGVLSAFLWRFGTRMASHVEQRHPFSGAVLVTFALIGLFVTLMLFYATLDGKAWQKVYPAFMLMSAAAALGTAYRFALRWPLVLGVLLVFHALGSWHAYAGQGVYGLTMSDERIMAMVAMISIVFGLMHETLLERNAQARWLGFGHHYLVVGLVYFNLALWFLSLSAGSERADALPWVLIFTLAGIAQLVAGTCLHDRRFMGFAIVFLAINLYTRYFEHFWDELSRGLFFLCGGLGAVLAGALMEWQARRGRRGDGGCGNSSGDSDGEPA